MNVYDFDKTIYNGDSTIDFCLFSLKKKPSLLRYLPLQIWGAALYFLGKIDKTKWKEKFFCFVKSIDCRTYVDAFWVQNKKKIATWYIEQQTDDDVIISASPDFLLRPICNQLNIQHVLASDVDPHTGNFLSENCYGPTKVKRYRDLFGEQRIDNFYSDSFSDFPMAQIAANAFLVAEGTIQEWSRNDGGELLSVTPKKSFDLRETILYLFFGACTVGVNVLSYSLLYECLKISNFWSSLLAWLIAAFFAYLTNKKFVFNSKSSTTAKNISEFLKFFTCRILTGVLDIMIMLVAVDYLHWNNVFWKLISSIIVTSVNYFASKIIIF